MKDTVEAVDFLEFSLDIMCFLWVIYCIFIEVLALVRHSVDPGYPVQRCINIPEAQSTTTVRIVWFKHILFPKQGGNRIGPAMLYDLERT
jgi:hypothetical protein